MQPREHCTRTWDERRGSQPYLDFQKLRKQIIQKGRKECCQRETLPGIGCRSGAETGRGKERRKVMETQASDAQTARHSRQRKDQLFQGKFLPQRLARKNVSSNGAQKGKTSKKYWGKRSVSGGPTVIRASRIIPPLGFLFWIGEQRKTKKGNWVEWPSRVGKKELWGSRPR